jgi:hypothetical protein
MNPTAIRSLFVVAAVYDGLLGLLFLLAPNWAFTQFDITPPNHVGYVQFPAALLIIFGVMFFNIARSPQQCSQLIFYGILLKVAYCSVTFGHWFSSDIPWIWKPFAVIDLLMLALFVWAWMSIRSASPLRTASQS